MVNEIIDKLKLLGSDKVSFEDISGTEGVSVLFFMTIVDSIVISLRYESDPDDFDYLSSVRKIDSKKSYGLESDTLDGIIHEIKKQLIRLKNEK